MASFRSNLIQFTPNDPLFWKVYTKIGPFLWDPTPIDPFFLRNPTPIATCFRSPVDALIPVTFIFEGPPGDMYT